MEGVEHVEGFLSEGNDTFSSLQEFCNFLFQSLFDARLSRSESI